MEQGLTPEQALVLAVNRMGSQAAMARLCNVAQPSVWHWLNESKQLPAEHVLKVEAATRVSRHDLRPDLYPRGLQDDTPYELAATLDLGGDLVADDPQAILQSRPQGVRGTAEDADREVLQPPGASADRPDTPERSAA